MASKYILMTIDVEDWFQVENLSGYIKRTEWESLPSRVERNTIKLLDLFEGHKKNIKATFFILGWIAEKFPQLLHEIAKRGHEIASHGYGHELCSSLSSEPLFADLSRSKKTIEDLTGVEVRGYRAPSFSISNDALRNVMKAGYRYDSSYNSFERHGRYGSISINGYPKNGIAIKMAPDFYELPISNLKILSQTIPWGGGGYFRLIPFSIFKKGVEGILSKDRAYMFYMHPWEIDPAQPRIKQAKGLPAFRHYLNLNRVYNRLYKMITAFQDLEFLTCSQYIEKQKDVLKSIDRTLGSGLH